MEEKNYSTLNGEEQNLKALLRVQKEILLGEYRQKLMSLIHFKEISMEESYNKLLPVWFPLGYDSLTLGNQLTWLTYIESNLTDDNTAIDEKFFHRLHKEPSQVFKSFHCFSNNSWPVEIVLTQCEYIFHLAPMQITKCFGYPCSFKGVKFVLYIVCSQEHLGTCNEKINELIYNVILYTPQQDFENLLRRGQVLVCGNGTQATQYIDIFKTPSVFPDRFLYPDMSRTYKLVCNRGKDNELSFQFENKSLDLEDMYFEDITRLVGRCSGQSEYINLLPDLYDPTYYPPLVPNKM